MSKDGATLTSYSGVSSSVNFTESSDLFFGLRGAGASLGIVTEFLYTVHPHPETKAVLLLVFVTKVSEREFICISPESIIVSFICILIYFSTN